ncbi:S8 family serine peptidase [Xanthomonas medicagonis]|uniref:S8 family serine peptidase n=1 Tax=Xanthomonas medicagonis TaxID=3160841 RepID=UPI0035174024
MKKKSTELLLAAMLLTLSAASASAQTPGSGGGKFTAKRLLQEAALPRLDAQGRRLYAVSLNPFVLQETEQLYAKSSPADFGTIDPAIRPHQNSKGMVHFAQQVAQLPGVKIERVLSTVANVVYAWMPERVAAQLTKADWVVSVRGVDATPGVFSQTSGDIVDNGEVVPWALAYTNTNDTFTTSNPFYMLDEVLATPANPDLNIVYRQELPDQPNAPRHSTMVAGVAAARRNGQLVRGVNPGQPIKAFAIQPTEADVVYQFNAAARHAEEQGEFAVLNISVNHAGTKLFASNHAWGRVMRAASNRFFITESSGNFSTGDAWTIENACAVAFGYAGQARDADGIMVVGGLERDGSRFKGDYITEVDAEGIPATGFVNGSTSGPCVEAWAPAHQISVLRYLGGLQVSSGTSYAAPIVAAIASRYGDNQTRPIEREAYIKASLSDTGYNEAGLPLRKVQYTAPSSHNLPRRLPIVGATSPTNADNLASLYDARFFSDSAYWNAHAYWGSVTLDLGQLRTVTGVRITVRTSASDLAPTAQPIAFEVSAGTPGAVFGGGSGGGQISYGAPVYHTEPDQSDVAPVYIPLSGGARYLKIDANNPYSWLAYSEIEVYGY